MGRKGSALAGLLSCFNNTVSLKSLAHIGILYLKADVGQEQRVSQPKRAPHRAKESAAGSGRPPDPGPKALLQPRGPVRKPGCRRLIV